jgi:hypothetical protein
VAFGGGGRAAACVSEQGLLLDGEGGGLTDAAEDERERGVEEPRGGLAGTHAWG